MATKTKTKKAPVVNETPISPNQVKILQLLKGGKELTRKQMGEKLEIEKGFSKLLGAPTSEDSEKTHPNALQTRGYVTSREPEEDEGGSALRYSITKAGGLALEVALKEAKEEPKKKEKVKAESNGKASAKKAPAKKKKPAKKIKTVTDEPEEEAEEDAGDE